MDAVQRCAVLTCWCKISGVDLTVVALQVCLLCMLFDAEFVKGEGTHAPYAGSESMLITSGHRWRPTCIMLADIMAKMVLSANAE